MARDAGQMQLGQIQLDRSGWGGRGCARRSCEQCIQVGAAGVEVADPNSQADMD